MKFIRYPVETLEALHAWASVEDVVLEVPDGAPPMIGGEEAMVRFETDRPRLAVAVIAKAVQHGASLRLRVEPREVSKLRRIGMTTTLPSAIRDDEDTLTTGASTLPVISVPPREDALADTLISTNEANGVFDSRRGGSDKARAAVEAARAAATRAGMSTRLANGLSGRVNVASPQRVPSLSSRRVQAAPATARSNGASHGAEAAPPTRPAEKGSPESLAGRTFGGKYVIEGPLGTGAMGAVFLARQLPLGQRVAVKIMRTELTKHRSFVSRFRREAKAATLFDHPNGVRVVDFGSEGDELLYLVMEYVEGRNLADLLEAEGALDRDRILSITRQVLGVLARAHEKGIVHRDLKPENILVATGVNDDGEPVDTVKVCDFGMAKLLTEDPTSSEQSLTGQNHIVGTPEFMSPEQAKAGAVDGRSDLYSLGVVMFNMLTGVLPFEGDTAVKLIVQHCTVRAPTPSVVKTDADPRFDAIIEKALEKDPDKRFQTAREMRTALRVLSAGMARGGVYQTGETAPLPPAAPSPRDETTFRGKGRAIRAAVRMARAKKVYATALAFAFTLVAMMAVFRRCG